MSPVPFSMGFDIFSIIPFVFIAIVVVGIVDAVSRRSRGAGTDAPRNDTFMQDMQHRQFMEQAQRDAQLHQQMAEQAHRDAMQQQQNMNDINRL